MPSRPHPLAILAVCLLTPFPLCSQQSQVDLNAYYRFPWSLGLAYSSLTPMAGYLYGAPFSISDLSLEIRVPITPLPILQPAIRGGLVNYVSQSQTESPLKWTHMDVYGELGLIYATRFAKTFEVGADLFAGVSESLFSNLIPGAAGPLGSANVLFDAGGRIVLDPAFNLDVEIKPSIRYQAGIGAVHEFDGPVFGAGFSVSYRYGQDPDAPTAPIRALRFEDLSMPHAFAAMQSWYAKNPAGKIVIVNTEKVPLTDMDVSFYQKGYMDSPSLAARVGSLPAGARREVALLALFNDAVFSVEGVTPLSGEVIVTYRMNGRPAEQREPVSFDLYDKRAIVWDDDCKVAALMTPDDTALKNYGGFIRQTCRQDVVPGLGEPLQLAMQVFAALGEIGCLYQANTQLPFASVQGNPTVVDTVHLARDTLKSALGDCSDLTVLYCSMLEALAVDTGFITVPGHIFAAFNTKVPSRDFRRVYPDLGMILDVDGEVWIPVEITLIGQARFLDAWRKGMEEWTALDSDKGKRAFYKTKDAWQLYRPVGLKETDLGLQYGRAETIADGFRKDRDSLVDIVAGSMLLAAQASAAASDWNGAGIALARFRQYARAEQAFQQALQKDPGNVAAQINLGNLLFLQKRYTEALGAYGKARDLLDTIGPAKKSEHMVALLLDISRACYALGQYAQAREYYGQASAIDSEKVKGYEYLGEGTGSGTRGADEGDPARDIIFVSE